MVQDGERWAQDEKITEKENSYRFSLMHTDKS